MKENYVRYAHAHTPGLVLSERAYGSFFTLCI